MTGAQETYLEMLGKQAQNAEKILARASTAAKDRALLLAAEALKARENEIIDANREDLQAAAEKGMSEPMQDRLRLTEKRIDGICEGLRQVAGLEDPVGQVLGGGTRPNGLRIVKTAVPLGVIGIIFEARPNVTADAAALCVKSGNACILRGGKEALRSNMAISEVFRGALERAGLPGDCVQLISDTSRELAAGFMRLDKYVDVLIPRGGAGLINAVKSGASVPVIQTGTGNCHVYVDADADLEMAENIVINAKTQRPSVCNAMETLLVHRKIADEFIPRICRALLERNVELRVCEKTAAILDENRISAYRPAETADWETEYDDLILAVKVADTLSDAIEHIDRYGTRHSEAIVTRNYEAAQEFQQAVDAACVYVNASTRFTDGFEFGLGAEIGISNQKLHTRGPMGLRELTTVKYLINGSGQTRK